MSAPPLPVYLDHAATTPLDARVAARMAEILSSETEYGNPASASIAAAIVTTPNVTRVPQIFGITCRTMLYKGFAPSAER